jgi:DNA-binding XRE family transcriptional regulator
MFQDQRYIKHLNIKIPRLEHLLKLFLQPLLISQYREDLSQKELAKLCGISQESLSKMENGKRAIGEKVAKKIATALNIDYRMLLMEN